MGTLVQLRRDERVAILILSRPTKLNAISVAVQEELDAALASDAVRSSAAVVICGDGRCFSAGADVSEFRARTPRDILDDYAASGGLFERLARLQQPTVAAIHGYCLGGGFELALACDMRIADRTAVFGLPEVSIGILPSSGGLTRLVEAVGPQRAKELMLWRERIDAAEALRLGLVTEVVEEGRALDRALEGAARLAALPELAVRVTKRAAAAAAGSSAEAAVLIEQLGYAALAQTADADEAAAAFTEKRAPRFTGR